LLKNFNYLDSIKLASLEYIFIMYENILCMKVNEIILRYSKYAVNKLGIYIFKIKLNTTKRFFIKTFANL